MRHVATVPHISSSTRSGGGVPAIRGAWRMMGAFLLVLLLLSTVLFGRPTAATAEPASESSLSYVNRDGRVCSYDFATQESAFLGASTHSKAYWSPDGHYAICISAGRADEAYYLLNVVVFDRWTKTKRVIRNSDGKSFPANPGVVRFGGWSGDSTRFCLVLQAMNTSSTPRLIVFAAASASPLRSIICGAGTAAAISPDGRRVVYSYGGKESAGGGESLWMLNISTGGHSKWLDRTAFGGHKDGIVRPYWPLHGSRLILAVEPPSWDAFWSRDLFLAAADLSTKAIKYFPSESGSVLDVSDDGHYVLVRAQPVDAAVGQYAVDLLDTWSDVSNRLVSSDALAGLGYLNSARLSPDCTRIAFEAWNASDPSVWDFRLYWCSVAAPSPAYIGKGKCPTWIPAAWPTTRTDLVVSLRNLKKDVAAAENRTVKKMAMALAVVSIDRRIAKTFNWLAFFWKAIRSTSSAVLTAVDNLVGMGARDFVLGKLKDDPQLTQQALSKYSRWASENSPEMGGIKAYLFASGLLGNWRSVHDYELFCDGYSDLSKAADGWRKKYGSDNFGAIYKAMIGEVAGSDYLTVPLRRGASGPTGMPASAGFAATPNRLLAALNAQCDAALAALPVRLPANLDVAALVTEINQVRASVRMLGIHTVPYTNGYLAETGWTTAEDKSSLGLLDDDYELLKDLEDCFSAKMSVQTTEAIQGGAEWPVMWISTFAPVGGKAKQVIDNLDLAANVHLDGREAMAPQAEVKPIEAMNQLETKMLLDTKTELARLYQVTAGLSGYVRSQVDN